MPVTGFRWVRDADGSGAFKVAKPVIERECQKIIDELFKPRLAKVKPALDFNYPIAVFGSWHGKSFRFALRLRTGTNSVPTEEFDSPFTRIEFHAKDNFNLYFFRHTGRWTLVDGGLTLDAALKQIREEGILQPHF